MLQQKLTDTECFVQPHSLLQVLYFGWKAVPLTKIQLYFSMRKKSIKNACLILVYLISKYTVSISDSIKSFDLKNIYSIFTKIIFLSYHRSFMVTTTNHCINSMKNKFLNAKNLKIVN